MAALVEPLQEPLSTTSDASDDISASMLAVDASRSGAAPALASTSTLQEPPVDSLSASFASYVDATLNPQDIETTLQPTVAAGSGAPQSQYLLPLPNAKLNRSQTSFAAPDEDTMLGLDMENLPPEIATADITMANDNSFIETSSGAAARELKKRFDQYLGVGKDVRSPYAITAFTNQHGRQMFRVGARGLSAPAASMEDNEMPVVGRAGRSKSMAVPSSPSTSQPPQHGTALTTSSTQNSRTRRPRMSVHSFLPPAIFRNGPVPAPVPAPTPAAPAPPPSTVSVPASVAPPENNPSAPDHRLRRTRSIPNMASPSPTPEPAPSTAPTPAPAGRPHAHSVSSTDAWPPQSRSIAPVEIPIPVLPVTQDTLADVLFKAPTGPPSPIGSGGVMYSSGGYTVPTELSFDVLSNLGRKQLIPHPFGPAIEFEVPSWQASTAQLGATPPLREMQSFESGHTARAPTSRSSRTTRSSEKHSDEDSSLAEESSSDPSTPVMASPSFSPAPETAVHSRYSTDIFDVLQNYKGLPVPERLTSIRNTIRLSTRDPETAVPRDDPRFVIWGYLKTDDHDEVSPSRTNTTTTDVSSGHSVLSRRKSGKEKHYAPGTETPFVHIEEPTKVLAAATIERWIAQLTSELNYDELLMFFLTYRTYISALDLGHLLICRFHWALEQPNSSHDEMVRRIVRVRTFIAIRYWLLTFFSVDFVPNRDLRVLFANWINTLRKDPILTRHRDAPSIVQKLRKVVLECKNSYTRGRESRRDAASSSGRPSTASPPSAPTPAPTPTPSHRPAPAPGVLGDLSNGHFAESLRRAVQGQELEEDIDLDFEDVNAADDFALTAAPGTATPVSAVDLAMMRQPLHLSYPYLQYGKTTGTGALTTTISSHVPLPVPHSTLSRVVVNAIGRLGRWKRVLNYRTANTRAPLRPPIGFGGACVDATAFDFEANETGDILVNGGVEHYLKMHEKQIMARVGPRTLDGAQMQATPRSSQDTSAYRFEDPPRPSVTLSEPETILESVTESSEEDSTTEEALTDRHASSILSVGSTPGEPTPRHARNSSSTTGSNGFRVDVISIDDLDLSDLSDVESPPPAAAAPAALGLRRLPRRLPNRRDFEFVRRSIETVSSMGIRTRDSVLSGTSSVLSSISIPGGPGGAGDVQPPAAIEQWQVNAIVDSLSDDEEEGDVEAALRRLEGQINQDKQKAKQSKVDNWVRAVRERLVTGQQFTTATGSGTSTSPERGRRRDSSDEEEDYGEVQGSRFMPGEGDTASRGSASWAVASSHAHSRSSVSSAKSPVSVSAVQAAPDERAPVLPPGLEQAPPTPAPTSASTKAPTSTAVALSVNSRIEAELLATLGTGERSKSTAVRSSSASYGDEEGARIVSKAGAADSVRSASTSAGSRSVDDLPATSSAPLSLSHPQPQFLPTPLHLPGAMSSAASMSAASGGMELTNGDPRLFTPLEKQLKRHRSFVLSHKSDVLCQHFAMIDRELFLSLKFEELVAHDWAAAPSAASPTTGPGNADDEGIVNASINALDWAQFLRDRARTIAEGGKTSDLVAIRNRFNLMANFVASEIVLTSPTDRLMIYSKFIRIAWKAYCMKSFNTLVAVLAGLDTPWVKKALRQTSAKPGIWESRMLRDLQQWATNEDDFKHIRQTVEALAETKPVVASTSAATDEGGAGDSQTVSTSRSRAPSDLKPPPPPACVPFFGVYLSQLHRFSVLPDLIDPTAPNEPVGIDDSTNTFESPAHPEVFANLAPLPPSVQLEPLINVHKQRLVAGVVKSLVAAQHLAVKVQFSTEKKLFQKCLKLRGLDDDTLQRALAVYSSPSDA